MQDAAAIYYLFFADQCKAWLYIVDSILSYEIPIFFSWS